MIYAFRGWIAFLAFMDLGTAVRSYIEKRSFLSKTIDDINQYVDGKWVDLIGLINSHSFIFRRIYNFKNFRDVFNTESSIFNSLHFVHTLQTVSRYLDLQFSI